MRACRIVGGSDCGCRMALPYVTDNGPACPDLEYVLRVSFCAVSLYYSAALSTKLCHFIQGQAGMHLALGRRPRTATAPSRSWPEEQCRAHLRLTLCLSRLEAGHDRLLGRFMPSFRPVRFPARIGRIPGMSPPEGAMPRRVRCRRRDQPADRGWIAPCEQRRGLDSPRGGKERTTADEQDCAQGAGLG